MLRGGIHHQQQQQLAKLLSDNGYAGDLPSSFYASIPAGSDLMKWLVTSLSNVNFVHPVDVALAAEYNQSKQALAADRSDLLALRSQGPPVNTQEHGGWLSAELPEEDEAQLRELTREHALMKAQLQEMQALERSLDAAQQAQRARHQRSDAQAMRDAKTLSTETASLSQLNEQLNAQLVSLGESIREIHQLVTVHGRRWLLLASNMDAYMAEDKRFVDTIMQFTDSCKPDSAANGGAASGNSSDLDGPAMKELQRLRMAFYLSEMEAVQAKARLAGAQAMATELETMAAQTSNKHAGSSQSLWLDDRARGQLAARVRTLEQEQERLMQQQVPELVTKLAQLQDTYVFQGQGALKETQLQRRISLVQHVVEALVGQGARHLVMDQLQQQEQRKLQAVMAMMKEVCSHIGSITNAAQARSENYERAAAYTAANGFASGSSSRPLTSTPPPTTSSVPPTPPRHSSASGQLSLTPGPSQSATQPPSLSPMRTTSSGRARDRGLQAYLCALQDVLADAGLQDAQGDVPSSPATRTLQTQTSLASQAHQLSGSAVQCARALTQLQSQLESALSEVQAASAQSIPEQVASATATASLARSLVFSPSDPTPTPTHSTQGHAPAASQPVSPRAGAKAAQQSDKPVLSSPDLTAALNQLSRLNDALQAATNEVVVGYQEHTARLERHKADAALERSVLKMFHLHPEKLEETVTELQSRLDAATAAAM